MQIAVITPTQDLFAKWLEENVDPKYYGNYTAVNNLQHVRGVYFKEVVHGFCSDEVDYVVCQAAYSRIKPEPLIKLHDVPDEVKELTALTSLKIVLERNKRLEVQIEALDKENDYNRIRVRKLEETLAKCRSGKRELRKQNKALKAMIPCENIKLK